MQKLYIIFSTIAIVFLILTYLNIFQEEIFVQKTEGTIQCKNAKDEKVDWYVMLKLPNNYNDGKAFLYIDDTLDEFERHEDLNDRKSPLMNTLAQIKDIGSKKYASVFWTDQPNVESASGVYAHAKGILGVDNVSGFILNHTTPKFPMITDDNQLDLTVDDSQLKFGQHFFCFSTDTKNINKYADGLQLDRVFTFQESNVPEDLDDQLHNLTVLLEKKQKQGTFAEISIRTLNDQQIIKFAKSGKWVESFYNKVVSPSYQQDFIFETWARPLSDPDCGKNSVVSNLAVKFSDEIEYSYTKDHSKFGISIKEDIVCFGDINRQGSQDKRGGGTNCFNNEKIHDFIKNAFVEQQKC